MFGLLIVVSGGMVLQEEVGEGWLCSREFVRSRLRKALYVLVVILSPRRPGMHPANNS